MNGVMQLFLILVIVLGRSASAAPPATSGRPAGHPHAGQARPDNGSWHPGPWNGRRHQPHQGPGYSTSWFLGPGVSAYYVFPYAGSQWSYSWGAFAPWQYSTGIEYYDEFAPAWNGRNLSARQLGVPWSDEPWSDELVPQKDIDEVENRGKDAERPLVLRPKPRVTPPAARQRCLRYIELGDAAFVRQQYEDALRQYKLAAAAAPGMSLPWYRRMLAYVATRRYDSALSSCRRAVAIEPAINDDLAPLSPLYGDQPAARNAHWESLAGRALESPDDPTPLLLLAVIFYCDGEHQRAQKYLQAARHLLPADDELLATFANALPDTRPVVSNGRDT